MKEAWYLGHNAADVADRALLVGDPARIDRIAELLCNVRFLPVKRGLRTITGLYDGVRITVAAFGMGAPIATIVLHELADLGVDKFLRIGTAMYFGEAQPGELIAADRGMAFDGTSPSYGSQAIVPADSRILDIISEKAAAEGVMVRRGMFATFDAFYREMFALPGDAEASSRIEANRAKLDELKAVATDMETAALLSASRALGVACSSLCLGTVSGKTLEKLGPEQTAIGEARLFRIGIGALAAL